MSKANNGGPAFPCDITANGHRIVCDGMTLRDWYAGMAVQGLLSDASVQGTPEEFAQRSFSVADAMLKERLKFQRYHTAEVD